jgi:ABC-2 type transport system ATP-binding protein
LLVESDNARHAQAALEGFPGVVATAQIGAQLRVLTDGESDDTSARIAERLQQAGVDAHVEKTLPNLEDVFVAATRRPSRSGSAPEKHA